MLLLFTEEGRRWSLFLANSSDNDVGKGKEMFKQHSSNDRPGLRPLWQLLLAEQTGFLPSPTCAEYRVLLDFLTQLVAEGCDPARISRHLAHCLIRVRECGQAG